jgi:hypothetical protein
VTRKEFAVILAGMNANWNMDFSDEMKIELWYSNLCDLDYLLVVQAMSKLVMTEKFPPTIAHIREACQSIVAPRLNQVDAVALITKALSNYGRSRHHEAMEYIKANDEATYHIIKAIGWQNVCNGNMDFVRPEIERLHKIAATEINTNNLLSAETKIKIAEIRSGLASSALAIEAGDGY